MYSSDHSPAANFHESNVLGGGLAWNDSNHGWRAQNMNNEWELKEIMIEWKENND